MIPEKIEQLTASLAWKTKRNICMWDLLPNLPDKYENTMIKDFIGELSLDPYKVYCLPHNDGCILLSLSADGERFVFGIQQKQYMPPHDYYYPGMQELFQALNSTVKENVEWQYSQPNGLYLFIDDITKDVDIDDVYKEYEQYMLS